MTKYLILMAPILAFYNTLPVRGFIFLHEGFAPSTAAERELADEVDATLDEFQPQSPGRAHYFDEMKIIPPIDPISRKWLPCTYTSWVLNITEVRPLPNGWWAEVVVGLDVSFSNGNKCGIGTSYREAYSYKNEEAYSYKNDRLTLEKSWVELRPPPASRKY
jgi:hypothetical protein